MKGVLAQIEQNVQCDNLINSSAFVVSKGLNDLFTRSRNARCRDKQKNTYGISLPGTANKTPASASAAYIWSKSWKGKEIVYPEFSDVVQIEVNLESWLDYCLSCLSGVRDCSAQRCSVSINGRTKLSAPGQSFICITNTMFEKLLEAIFGEKWGPKLFLTVAVISLVFFWWLLIYSHGVTPHGG